MIAPEAATVPGLIGGYAAILAAIPALAMMINGFLPHCLFGVCVTSNPVFVVASGIVFYLVSLAGVFVVGLIIDALAPSFSAARRTRSRA